jgi:hypothetical protein
VVFNKLEGRWCDTTRGWTYFTVESVGLGVRVDVGYCVRFRGAMVTTSESGCAISDAVVISLPGADDVS